MEIQEAVDFIRAEGVVAFPTETVYGLGAPIFAPEVIAKLFVLKRRPKDNPLIAHISDLSQVEHIASAIPDLFYRLAELFFPGPLTIVLSKHPDVPMIATGGLDTIGVRMPAHPIAQKLIAALGEPLVAPSANLSGRPSSTSAAHVRQDFGDCVPVLDGGMCEVGLESTVIALLPEPVILRQGSVTQQTLEEAVGGSFILSDSTRGKPPSPGMKYRHYKPDATVHLVEEVHSCSDKQRYIDAVAPKTLYDQLRQADLDGIEELFIRCPEDLPENSALMNRLRRAASMC